MRFSSGNLEDFIKTKIINGSLEHNPALMHLNLTGYSIEDLRALTCIEDRELKEVVLRSRMPQDYILNSLEKVFELPKGTMKEEYNLWLASLKD